MGFAIRVRCTLTFYKSGLKVKHRMWRNLHWLHFPLNSCWNVCVSLVRSVWNNEVVKVGVLCCVDWLFGNWPKLDFCLLAALLRLTLAPEERCCELFSGRGSNPQPSGWDAALNLLKAFMTFQSETATQKAATPMKPRWAARFINVEPCCARAELSSCKSSTWFRYSAMCLRSCVTPSHQRKVTLPPSLPLWAFVTCVQLLLHMYT